MRIDSFIKPQLCYQVLPTSQTWETQGQAGYGLGKAGDVGTAKRQSSASSGVQGEPGVQAPRRSMVPDQINTQHLTSLGKLKSRSRASVGIPPEHEHQGYGQKMCRKLGGMEGKGWSVRKRNRKGSREHEGVEPHTQFSSISASFL